MRVELMYTTPDYLLAIWAAGHTCHSPLAPQKLFKEPPSREKMLNVADFLVKSKHLSVLEHCSMTFAVSEVSRTLLAQYSRHRVGVSLSVQSQRYVSHCSEDGILFDHIIPPTIESSPNGIAVMNSAMIECQEAYDGLIALGIPKEDARFVLPGAICTNFVTTLNLRSFLDVYSKRVCVKGAQWEIKELVSKMADLLLEREPWLASYLDKTEEVNGD